MSEDLYPRPLYLANYTAFQASHAYTLGTIVKPTASNNHIYIVTTAGTSSSEPSWPTTSQTTITSGSVVFTEHGTVPGVQYLKFLKVRKDWDSITLVSKYEDGGIDTNESAANCLQEYHFSYDGLTDSDAYILDAFWDAHRRHVPFTLVEPRNHPWTGEGDIIATCRFISFEKDHDKVKGVQKREVVIGKYPS